MSMIKYCVIDAEMGGRDLKYSLLTAYFMVTDENFNVLGELDLKVKPDSSDYFLSAQGMEVNQIDLQAHDKLALPYKDAKPRLYNFLKQHSVGQHLVPVGHAVKGDIAHVTQSLISEGSWHQFCTYHYIDTSVVLQFLRACGKMPLDTDGSVSALAKYFNIEIDEEYLHTCKYDAMLTAKVFQAMINLGK